MTAQETSNTSKGQKIVTTLWFDDSIEEAANFYVSVFKNSKIKNMSYYSEAGPKPAGTVLTVTFELDGQEFMALNGGPAFNFTPAISLMVKCDTQEEVDHLWDTLIEGGRADQCGWLQDKYGLSWQIIPNALSEMMSDKDPVKVKKIMEAMLQMVKLDINVLKEAFNS